MNFDIELIKRKLLVKYPLFRNIVIDTDYIINTTIPTAETDGEKIYFNPEFLNKISVEQQMFVFAHEICHIAFNHILRSEGKNPFVWNIAADAVINAFLKRDGLLTVDGVIDISDAINYDVERLYEKLLLENKTQQKKVIEIYGSGHDTHSMWDETLKKIRENQKKGIAQKDEKEIFKRNLEEKKKELQELKSVLSKQAIGKLPLTNIKTRDISDIGKAKSLIDWRYILKETINYEIDWSYSDATIEDGVVSANLKEQLIPETEILLDTSKSIDEKLLKNFLKECKNILKHSKLKIGCFDTQFYGFNEIRTEEDIDNMDFQGGGGTDFNVAVSAFSKRVKNKIIFTDGDSHMPNRSFDAIWIVFGGLDINPKGGKVIHINDKQLNSLYFSLQDYEAKGRSI